MPDGCHRVDEKHPRAGEAHDDADAFPHVGLVAVDPAVGAEGFGLHEGAFVTTHAGVGFQVGTFRTEVCLPKPVCFPYGFMLFPAIEQDHIGDHLLFTFSLVLYLVSFLCILVQS